MGKVVTEKYNIRIETEEYCFGVGWWYCSAKLFVWMKTYYDGHWFAVRFGPFFFCKGPY